MRRQFAWVELAQVVFFSSVMYGTFLPTSRGVELKKRDSSMSRYNSAVVWKMCLFAQLKTDSFLFHFHLLLSLTAVILLLVPTICLFIPNTKSSVLKGPRMRCRAVFLFTYCSILYVFHIIRMMGTKWNGESKSILFSREQQWISKDRGLHLEIVCFSASTQNS
jgi:hypothetical protein